MGEIKIPESLMPENIMNTVNERLEKEKRKNRKKKRLVIISSVAGMAALVAIIYGIALKFIGISYKEEYSGVPGLYTVKNYDALYRYIEHCNFEVTKGLVNGEVIYDSSLDSESGDGAVNNDYSGTNIQTEGIDEGDIVKTDGKYIYVVRGWKGTVTVLKADGENTEIVSEIQADSIISEKYPKDDKDSIYVIHETYIYENRLVIIAQLGMITEYIGNYNDTYVLTVELYEGKAGKTYINRQAGEYLDSRMNDGILYLLTDEYVNYYYREKNSIAPTINEKEIAPEDAYFCNINDYTADNYIISSTDVLNQAKIIDSKVYIGNYVKLYVSKDNIYFIECEDKWNMANTNIVKFNMNEGNIVPVAKGKVEGWVNDQFSLDEYNGYLRVVTTSSSNSLFVLDEKMNVVGEIRNLAAGETIKSARFMGDTGYFVTYRNMDPLFAVDLSEPTSPKITDELKITGYSSYMHFMDENNLLGIGYEIEPDTQVIEGIKVTLFDASDKYHLSVKENILYENVWHTEAIFDHKAIMASDNKGLYGFALMYDLNMAAYVVFKYEDGNIKEVEKILVADRREDESDWTYRGMYIGDYFYLIGNAKIRVYSLGDIEAEGDATELGAITY